MCVCVCVCVCVSTPLRDVTEVEVCVHYFINSAVDGVTGKFNA